MERQWHPTQELRERSDGRVEMRLETTGRKAFGSEAQARRELIRWVLSWMPDVRVLELRSLWDRIVEKLQAGLRTQRTGF